MRTWGGEEETGIHKTKRSEMRKEKINRQVGMSAKTSEIEMKE